MESTGNKTIHLLPNGIIHLQGSIFGISFARVTFLLMTKTFLHLETNSKFLTQQFFSKIGQTFFLNQQKSGFRFIFLIYDKYLIPKYVGKHIIVFKRKPTQQNFEFSRQKIFISGSTISMGLNNNIFLNVVKHSNSFLIQKYIFLDMEKNYQVTPKGLSKICHTIVTQKGFCKPYNLVNNFDTIQKEKKKHRCGSCEKLFSRNYSLKKHIHSVH